MGEQLVTKLAKTHCLVALNSTPCFDSLRMRARNHQSHGDPASRSRRRAGNRGAAHVGEVIAIVGKRVDLHRRVIMALGMKGSACDYLNTAWHQRA